MIRRNIIVLILLNQRVQFLIIHFGLRINHNRIDSDIAHIILQGIDFPTCDAGFSRTEAVGGIAGHGDGFLAVAVLKIVFGGS
jgi:hypothetical protein